MSPIGVGVSVSKYVAHVQRVLEEDGRVKHQLGPMFTTLEGDISVCLDVIGKMNEALHAIPEVSRVSCVIKFDDRRDKVATMAGKLESVAKQLRH